MKITFLGTGTSQGVPVIACKCKVCQSENRKDKRLRSSVMLEVDEQTLVIDSGPDFRQQMLRENVQKLHAILITHQHKDHIAGLDDIRAFNYFMNTPMAVYGDERVLSALKREFAYVFEDDKYPGIPEMNIHLLENKAFNIANTKIIPIQVMHRFLPVFGFRIKDFTYITDANYISEEEKKKIKGSEILVINALRHKKHLSHFTVNEALEIIQEIAPKKAFLTHLSHQIGLHNEIEKQLPPKVSLAYDGLVLEI